MQEQIMTAFEDGLGVGEPARLSKNQRTQMLNAVDFGIKFAVAVLEKEYDKYEKQVNHLQGLRNNISAALADGSLDPSFGKQWHEVTTSFLRKHEIPGFAKYNEQTLDAIKTRLIAGSVTTRDVKRIEEMNNAIGQSMHDLRSEQERLKTFLDALKKTGFSDWSLAKEMEDSERETEELFKRLKKRNNQGG